VQHPGQGGGGGINIAPQLHRLRNAEATWAGFNSQGSSERMDVKPHSLEISNITLANIPMQTPSTHRQRLMPGNDPTPRPGFANLHSIGVARTPMLSSQRISPRQPLANLSGNNAGPTGFAGYGMSAGLKVSNPTGAAAQGLARPVMRSRGPSTNSANHRWLIDFLTVAQRPNSGPPNLNSTYGPPPAPNMFSNGNNYY
jgi:E3 ubiquitin-protein ligase CCNP1IP1